MTDPNELPLDWFQKLQLKKLSTPENMAKFHWLDMTGLALRKRLMDEVGELQTAIFESNDPEAIIDECVDVANFAAMLAHKVSESYPDTLCAKDEKKS